MPMMKITARMMCLTLVVGPFALHSLAATAEGGDEVKLVFEHPLPNLRGDKMVAVEVTYPPGGKSLAHRHAKSAFIYAYVLSGAVRSQVNDDPPKVYKAGESFYEMPGAHHQISENASATEPARLLAVFVVGAADEPLTTPDATIGSR